MFIVPHGNNPNTEMSICPEVRLMIRKLGGPFANDFVEQNSDFRDVEVREFRFGRGDR